MLFGNKLFCVSSPCGTQKTRSACKFIAEYHLQNFIYVVPSRVLAKEVCHTLETLGVSADEITSDTYPSRVMTTLMARMQCDPDRGQVLVCTARSYLDLPFRPSQGLWQVIIDEIPQVDDFIGLDLSNHLNWLTDVIEIQPFNTSLGKVIGSPNIRSILKKRDAMDMALEPLLRALNAPNRSVFIDLHSWDKAHELFSKGSDQCNVNFLAMLNRRPFDDAILMGANLEGSIAAHWLGGPFCGLRLAQHEPIHEKLSPPDQHLGRRLKLQHFLSDAHGSKTRLEAERENGPLIDEIERIAIERFAGKPTLYVANNSRVKTLLDDHSNFIRIPVHSQGLNKYQDIDNILITASLNRTPDHASMLDWLGITRNVQRAATAHEVFYQDVMRTSGRDPNCTRPVTCMLVDKASCEYIADVVPGASIELIPSSYRPKRPYTVAERKRRCRVAKWVHESTSAEVTRISLSNKEKSVTILKQILRGAISNPVFVTLHRSIFDKDPDQFGVVEQSVGSFARWMQVCSKVVLDCKTENRMMTPAVFLRPDAGEGYRRKDYFVASSLLMLDFDNGVITPLRFKAEFGTEQPIVAKRHPFIIFNSFSASPSYPNKFRVAMFFKRPALSLDEHEATYLYIRERLALSGYAPMDSGLDPNSKVANQTFYLPCTNREHPDYSFFDAHGADDRFVRRCGLDPQSLLATKSIRTRVPRLFEGYVADDEEIADIMEGLAGVQSGRTLAYFIVGRKLQSKGLGDDEIEHRFKQVLTTPEQQAKVAKTMQGLKRSRPRFAGGR